MCSYESLGKIQSCGCKCPPRSGNPPPGTVSCTPPRGGRAQVGGISGSPGSLGEPGGARPGEGLELREKPGAVAPCVSSLRWDLVAVLLRKPAGLRVPPLPHEAAPAPSHDSSSPVHQTPRSHVPLLPPPPQLSCQGLLSSPSPHPQPQGALSLPQGHLSDSRESSGLRGGGPGLWASGTGEVPGGPLPAPW